MPISAHVKRLRELVGNELLQLPGVAAVVRDAAGRVLVHRRADDGSWSLPAGAIDPGETPAAAAVREVREETGLDVRPTRVLGVFGGPRSRHRYPNGDLVEYLVVVFACEIVGGVLEPQDGEATGFRWCTRDELASLSLPYPQELFAPEAERTPVFDPPAASVSTLSSNDAEGRGIRAMLADIELVECDPARDGELIRALTRDNFYEAMKSSWDEARHQREPLHPERYRMLRRGGETIGFFALRDEGDNLYVQTIQLIPSARRGGIGSRVMEYIAHLAAEATRRTIRLRVLRSNHDARRFYERLGYRAITDDDSSSLLELVVAPSE